MKIVFAGTPQSAVPSLDALCSAGYSPLAVLTQPDRRRGRGRHLVPSAVAIRAEELGIPLLKPEKASDPAFQDTWTTLAPDLLVVVAYGQIFTDAFLNVPVHGAINLHFSLLPAHRGASPIQAAILAGEESTGVTVFRLVRRLDAGPMLAQQKVAIAQKENAGELESRLAELGGKLLAECLPRFEMNSLSWVDQDEERATICRTLVKSQGRIPWGEEASFLVRHIRAMTPWPGAFSELHQEGASPLRLIFLEAESEASGEVNRSEEVGRVLDTEGGALSIATGSGFLRVFRVKPAGKRDMSVESFLRGRSVAPGDRFR
ncbi:MAG: methionyl-tRNA formyltransferase [Planctomycetota bacterium]|jgi:methionyl-tRNA formyltransferase|nr:methionyl-tRNA formyltransferase [Planctomycetota bacterium]